VFMSARTTMCLCAHGPHTNQLPCVHKVSHAPFPSPAHSSSPSNSPSSSRPPRSLSRPHTRTRTHRSNSVANSDRAPQTKGLRRVVVVPQTSRPPRRVQTARVGRSVQGAVTRAVSYRTTRWCAYKTRRMKRRRKEGRRQGRRGLSRGGHKEVWEGVERGTWAPGAQDATQSLWQGGRGRAPRWSAYLALDHSALGALSIVISPTPHHVRPWEQCQSLGQSRASARRASHRHRGQRKLIPARGWHLAFTSP